MRILLLIDCYSPSTKSGARQMHDMAVELRRRGHEVIVCTPQPGLAADNTIALEDGVTVLRIRTGRIKGAGKLLRGINEARLPSVLWGAGKKFFQDNPCDLIVFYSPTIFFAGLVRRLKRLYNCPAYLILRDIFPQWALDAGILHKGLAYWYLRRKEIEQYRVADIIGVQSPANLSYFNENGLSGLRLEVLFNWVALTEPKVASESFRERWGLKDKIVFFYGGNIGVAQDMDNIVRLAKGLRNETNIFFLVVGEGSEVPRLRRAIMEQGLTNVVIHDAIKQDDYFAMVGEFDVGLITLDRSLKTHNFPGKMLDYMFHHMPILASINPGNDLKDIIEQNEAGLVCLNGDDRKFLDLTLRLAREKDLRARLGSNARRLLVSTFSVSRAVDQILALRSPPEHRPAVISGTLSEVVET